MKKILSLMLFLTISLAFVFAGGSQEKTQEDGVTTIRVISVFQTENPEGPAEMEITERFMKENPDVKVEFIGVPMNDLFTKLTALATANDLPDAYFMTTEFKTKAVDLGIAEDLNNLFTEEEINEFIPATIADASVGDSLVYLPFIATPPALIYRADWFADKGLDVPTDWDEFRDVAKSLTEDTNNDGKIDRWGFAMLAMRNGSAAGRFLYMMRTFGIKELYQDADGSWKTDIGSQKFQEALRMFTELATKDQVVPPGVIETGYPEASQSFASEKTAMMITGPNAIGTIYAQNPSLQGKIGSAVIPKDVEHVSTLGLNGYTINPQSDKKDAVVKWMKYLTSNENALYFNSISGRTPVKKALGDSEELKTVAMKGFVESLNYTYQLPGHPGFPEIQDIVGEAYQNTIANGMSIEEASAHAQERAIAVIQKYQ